MNLIVMHLPRHMKKVLLKQRILGSHTEESSGSGDTHIRKLNAGM